MSLAWFIAGRFMWHIVRMLIDKQLTVYEMYNKLKCAAWL